MGEETTVAQQRQARRRARRLAAGGTGQPHRWKKGESGNPSGRGRWSSEIRELARQYGPEAIANLVQLMRKGRLERTRFAAATVLLERGYGRPEQPVELTTGIHIADLDDEALRVLAGEVIAPPRIAPPLTRPPIEAPIVSGHVRARDDSPVTDSSESSLPLPAVLIGPDAATVHAAHEAAEATARAEAAQRAAAEQRAVEARAARTAVHTPGAQPLKRRH